MQITKLDKDGFPIIEKTDEGVLQDLKMYEICPSSIDCPFTS